tara:strand:- start:16205 stop:16363 length:159 start_codon:yes stop_codon:yes gene_type:complete
MVEIIFDMPNSMKGKKTEKSIKEMLSKSNINTDIVSFDFNEDDFTENEHSND